MFLKRRKKSNFLNYKKWHVIVKVLKEKFVIIQNDKKQASWKKLRSQTFNERRRGGGHIWFLVRDNFHQQRFGFLSDYQI